MQKKQKEKEEKKHAGLTQEEVLKSIQKSVTQVQKDLKLAPLSTQRASFVEDAIRTGCLCFDLITGGGLAPGRLSTVFGEEQAGKSLLVTSAMKTALTELNIPVVALAYEPLDPMFVARQGLDMHKFYGRRNKDGHLKPGEIQTLFLYAPDTAEQGLRMSHRMMDNLGPKTAGVPQILWLFDSFPAALPEILQEKDENAQSAQQAQTYSKYLPMVVSLLASRRCTMLGVNQLRLRPNTMFGSPEYEPCGEAIKYYSSMRAKMRKIGKPKDTYDMEEAHPLVVEKQIRAGGVYEEESIFGGMDRYTWTSISTTKNKTFAPHRGTYMRVWFEEDGDPGRGIDPVFDTWQFLYETDQLEFTKDEKGKQTDKFVIKVPNFGMEYDWMGFKKFILLDEGGKVLRQACAKQIEDSSAFEKYFNREKAEVITEEEKAEQEEKEVVYPATLPTETKEEA